MKEPKFTKGPWKIEDSSDSTIEPVVICGDLSIALCFGHLDDMETLANAHLIAAAPQLFEALELADAALSGANMNMDVVRKKARAALAKALGEHHE